MTQKTNPGPAPRPRKLANEPDPIDDWTAFKSESEWSQSEGKVVPLPAALAKRQAAPETPLDEPASAPFLVSPRVLALAALGVCALATALWLGWRTWTTQPAAAASQKPVVATGAAVFSSVPQGASISIDGTVRGVTPLRVSLNPGTYSVQLTSGAISRTLPITVEAGSVVSQYVELGAAPSTTGGRLEIGSDPPGAQVALDGVSRGVTPLVIADVPPGQHRVTVTAGDNTVNRTVNVTRGATSALVVSTAPVGAGASGGWLTVQAPMDMEILEDGKVLGTTKMERLMLPVGSHRVEITNAALEFSVARTIQIAAGRTANVAISLPTGRLSVNAVPWAEVSLDGVAIGTTPLGDLVVPIGTHELVFRHPQLGERRQTVTVKAQTPSRIGIDLRK